MNNQFTSNSSLSQDRPLPDVTPRQSWQRLTAGDEQAERLEGFLRGALVVSLFCSLFLSALHLRPAADATDGPRLALPTVHQPLIIQQARAAIHAALP